MTKSVGFSPASNLQDGLTGQDDFKLYLDLYRRYLDREIGWSEATSLLTPQYLHLHEEDIGSISNYTMKGYLSGFVSSLGEECRSALEQIIFTYSYESESGLEPNNCLRQRFFAFELTDPMLIQQSLKEAIVGFESKELRRPVDRSLEGPGGLEEVLRNCHLVQPYIVEMINPVTVKCIHNIQEVTEKNLKDLIRKFKRTGCYQFSIYGYRFKPDAVKLWMNSPVHRAFLEHAFVLHVLLWNYGLRSAHERASVINRTLTEVKNEWDEAKASTEHVFAKLSSFITGGSSVIERDSILPLPQTAFLSAEGLFRDAWGHSIVEFPLGSTKDSCSTSFAGFYHAVRQCATMGYQALNDFVNACGANVYIEQALHLTDRQRRSWERGIYAGTKLLTRRIQPNEDGDYGDELQGIGPDQVTLALLLGLPPSSKTGPKVSVSYIGRVEGVEPKDQRQTFLENLRISDPEESPWPELSCAWLSEELGLGWRNNGDNLARPYLASFVRSGLIRNVELLPNKILLHIPKPSPSEKMEHHDRFLAKVSRLVELCYKGDSEAGELHLEEITVTWSVSVALENMIIDYKSSKLVVELKCKGVLRSREKLYTGSFSRALWGINEFFSALLRGEKHEDSPGVYYVSEGQSCRLLIVLQSQQGIAV